MSDAALLQHLLPSSSRWLLISVGGLRVAWVPRGHQEMGVRDVISRTKQSTEALPLIGLLFGRRTVEPRALALSRLSKTARFRCGATPSQGPRPSVYDTCQNRRWHWCGYGTDEKYDPEVRYCGDRGGVRQWARRGEERYMPSVSVHATRPICLDGGWSPAEGSALAIESSSVAEESCLSLRRAWRVWIVATVALFLAMGHRLCSQRGRVGKNSGGSSGCSV